MNSWKLFVAALAAPTLFAGAGFAGEPMPGVKTQPNAGFERLKPLLEKLLFDFVDATNWSSPDAMHMHRLSVNLEDRNHFVQEWTWKSGEREGLVVSRMERVK